MRNWFRVVSYIRESMSEQKQADGNEHIIESYVDSTIMLVDLVEKVELAVIPLVGYDIILGIPWLTRHNPVIDWSTRAISVRVGNQFSRLPEYRESKTPAVG